MNNFTPIYPQQVDQLCRRLFEPGFRASHAAEPAYWINEEATKMLSLDRSVTPESFVSLLRRRSPGGNALRMEGLDPGQPCAWHRRYTAPGSVSVLWALGPPEINNLALAAHNYGIENDLYWAACNTTGFPYERGLKDVPHFLFACFPFCATDTQTPELHADVFWINTGFWLDGKAGEISKDYLKSVDSLADSYFDHLAMHLSVQFGEFRVHGHGFPDYQIIGVPRELYQANADARLQQNPSRHSPILCAKGTAASREQMLECWQRQAVEFGWARKELTALTTSIKRERACLYGPRKGGYVDGSREKIQAMTDHLLRQQQARFHAKTGPVAKKGHRV